MKSLCAFAMTVFLLSNATLSHANVMELGDLNIIDDAGNPSDGLRFLDMTFSNGLTLADALTNAQMTYMNARQATPSEFDDLFAAANVPASPNVGFSTGVTTAGSANPAVGDLALILGYTSNLIPHHPSQEFGQTRTDQPIALRPAIAWN